MDLRQVFAANLRRLRYAKGLFQEDLAYEANVNRSYMSKLEKGASYPGLEIMGKLATVCRREDACVADEFSRALDAGARADAKP
jgi:transcriptional regulator with XRE-family HTH domain